MKKSLKLTICCLGVAVASLCVGLLLQSDDCSLCNKKPKYVFYFIGDGMSFNHILGTEHYNTEKAGASETLRLNFTQFDTRNFVTNYSTSNLVTDSAAAGTALASGVKTANAHIGVDVDGNELRTIADVASELGYKVGLVTNVGINHATPSCFYGHTSDRFGFPSLVDDYIASDVAFIAGSTIMDMKSGPQDPKYKPVTTAELAERIRTAGITITLDVEEAAKTEGKRVVLVAHDKVNEHIPHVIDRASDEKHTMFNYAKAAIEYLTRESKEGFFLMIEAGKLDYSAHAQDAVTTFEEVNELAQAVDLALDFAEQHPDETLIVVTSDHETGGMSLGWDKYQIRMNQLVAQKHSMSYITKAIKQMRADGNRNWNDYKELLSDYLGLWSVVPITAEEEALLKHNFYDIFLKYGPMVDGLYNRNEYLAYHAVVILNRHASIEWTSKYHTGMYTPLFVKGVGEKRFLECCDQTEIPKTIASLMGGQL